MATASVTYNFLTGAFVIADEHDVNFADLVTFLNAETVHKDGSIAMTGILTLPGSDPTTANQAARKAYVDAQDATITTSIAGKVAKAGDTMTGQLVLVGNPVGASDAARKAYVDVTAEFFADAAEATALAATAAEAVTRAAADVARVTAPAVATNPKIVGSSVVGVTDANGKFTIATGLAGTPTSAVVSNGDNSAGVGLGTAILVQVEPMSGATITIQCIRNDNSAAVAGGVSVRVNWMAFGS